MALVKIGVVRKHKDKPGSYITLGNAKAKNKTYQSHAEVVATDADGNVTGHVKDGFVTIFDPRNKKGITPEETKRLDDNGIMFELLIQAAE